MDMRPILRPKMRTCISSIERFLVVYHSYITSYSESKRVILEETTPLLSKTALNNAERSVSYISWITLVSQKMIIGYDTELR